MNNEFTQGVEFQKNEIDTSKHFICKIFVIF